MSDQHSCSYHCDRPECIREQRDQLRDWMESVSQPLTPEREAKLVERESACREMIERLRNHGKWGLDPQDRWDIADELERLIDKVPFLERYIAKLEQEATL